MCITIISEIQSDSSFPVLEIDEICLWVGVSWKDSTDSAYKWLFR